MLMKSLVVFILQMKYNLAQDVNELFGGLFKK
jgi:hypothetical protein